MNLSCIGYAKMSFTLTHKQSASARMQEIVRSAQMQGKEHALDSWDGLVDDSN